MKQWILGCAALAALVAGGCAISSSPPDATSEEAATLCSPGQSCPLPTQAEALRQSCYAPAQLCGICPLSEVYDCVPVVSNPRKGFDADWDCLCCSGNTCI
jgi:hypothetical protein